MHAERAGFIVLVMKVGFYCGLSLISRTPTWCWSRRYAWNHLLTRSSHLVTSARTTPPGGSTQTSPTRHCPPVHHLNHGFPRYPSPSWPAPISSSPPPPIRTRRPEQEEPVGLWEDIPDRFPVAQERGLSLDYIFHLHSVAPTASLSILPGKDGLSVWTITTRWPMNEEPVKAGN